MTHKKIGFGLVGAGMIANYHAQAIKALSEKYNVHLAGVLGHSEQKLEAFAKEHDIPFYTTDSKTFFANPEIHIVCIVTPSGAHLEPALAAIEAGKHIIVEKPLEITVERSKKIIDTANQANVKFAAIFQARFSAGAQALKQAIDTGRFGRLVLCSAYVKWQRAASYYTGWKGTLAIDGGGAVINQSIHAIDLLQWFAGMPAEIFAWETRRTHLGIEAEDTACAALKFKNGALGAFEATTGTFPGWERRIEICGEFGSAAIEDDRIVRWDFKEIRPEDEALLAKNNQSGGSGAGSPDQISFVGHQKQIENMILAVRENQPLIVDGSQALNAVKFVRAIYESAEQGKPISL